MFWQEDNDHSTYQIPDDIQDLHFTIECREIPVDHLFALSQALLEKSPWLQQVTAAGVHEIYLAGSQNGWEKPDASAGHTLLLSKRTKLVIRIDKQNAAQLVDELMSSTLDIQGYNMLVGAAKHKPLVACETLNARHVAMLPAEITDENLFLERMVKELGEMNISLKKALCGKSSKIVTASGEIITRSLMLADLSPKDAISIQTKGLGDHRILGCGLFQPMKDINKIDLDS